MLLNMVYGINQGMDDRAVTDVGGQLDPQRLKYITEHFHSLQGLTWVVLGVSSLAVSVDDVYGYRLPALVGQILLFVPFLATARYVNRYYRRRFGWIEPRGPTNRQALVFLAAWLVLLFFGRDVGYYGGLIGDVMQSMIPDPSHHVTLAPVLIWFVFLCANLRHHPGQEDLYRIYFFGSGLLIWILVAVYPLWNLDLHPTMVWKGLNAGWLGISMIAIGLYGHMTLVRLMPQRVVGDDDSLEGNEYER
jgi:hypothetical protein